MTRGRISLLAALLTTASALPASAHSWYPRECCGVLECAPVEAATWVLPVGGGEPQLVVSTKHGKVAIPRNFPARESQDGRMHVCMGYDAFGARDVLCFFKPPSV
jgi:hypothetical protein